MLEVAAVREAANPHETLLVADAMTGQDAVNVAKAFGERAGITGDRADPGRRRRARRRGVVDARDHRQADRADRHRRADRSAGAVSCRADRRAHPRHGRCRQPGREGGRDGRPGRSRKARRQAGEGQFRPRRPRRPAASDPARWAGWGACWRCCRGSARSRSSSTRPISTRASCKRQEAIISSMTKKRAAQPEAAERLAPAAHRLGLGHLGAGDQPAPEAVSGHGRHDEEDEKARPEGLGAPRHRRR